MAARAFLAILFGVLTLPPIIAGQNQKPPGPDEPPDFVISPAFLENLRQQNTFLPTYKIKISARSKIKTPAEDCEVHLGGFLQEAFAFGEPPAVVVEPPNVCKFGPNATNPSTTSTSAAWVARLDSSVVGKDCSVTGFPRIYTEHAEGGTTGGSNPNHIFEIHPATEIVCGSAKPLKFINNLIAFTGLRHIKPASAHACITGLKMWVRFHDGPDEDHYEFFQRRPSTCGNFVIVEVTSIPREFIQKPSGGHTAIARILANGEDPLTLKLYAIDGSSTNAWLERVKAGKPQLTDPRLVHGILTYDFFQIFRTVGTKGTALGRPNEWTEIGFPLALVILGGTTVVPWEQ